MKRTTTALVLALLICIGHSPSFADSKKQLKIVVKLSATETITLKGSKSQLAKRLRLEAREREDVIQQIKTIEACKNQNCSPQDDSDAEEVSNGRIDLEKQEIESTKIISALAKSIYGPKAEDASNLAPLTKADFTFFIREVEYQIYLIEKELTSLRDRSSPALIAFLADYENTNYPKAGYSKEYAIETFKKNLEYQIRGLRKTILVLNNLIKDGNSEGTSEIKITPTILLAEMIATGNQNLGENL